MEEEKKKIERELNQVNHEPGNTIQEETWDSLLDQDLNPYQRPPYFYRQSSMLYKEWKDASTSPISASPKKEINSEELLEMDITTYARKIEAIDLVNDICNHLSYADYKQLTLVSKDIKEWANASRLRALSDKTDREFSKIKDNIEDETFQGWITTIFKRTIGSAKIQQMELFAEMTHFHLQEMRPLKMDFLRGAPIIEPFKEHLREILNTFRILCVFVSFSFSKDNPNDVPSYQDITDKILQFRIMDTKADQFIKTITRKHIEYINDDYWITGHWKEYQIMTLEEYEHEDGIYSAERVFYEHYRSITTKILLIYTGNKFTLNKQLMHDLIKTIFKVTPRKPGKKEFLSLCPTYITKEEIVIAMEERPVEMFLQIINNKNRTVQEAEYLQMRLERPDLEDEEAVKKWVNKWHKGFPVEVIQRHILRSKGYY